MEREKEAYLTAGASLVKRILTGNLMKDIPAVFVSSAYEDTGLVTDVFAFQNGVFQSVTMRGRKALFPLSAATMSTPPILTATG